MERRCWNISALLISPLRLVQLLMVFSIVCVASGYACSAATAEGYFYKQEKAVGAAADTCSAVFSEIINSEAKGKFRLPGKSISSLRYINVHHLLEDYDDAMRSGREKKFIAFNDLETEVAENKRSEEHT